MPRTPAAEPLRREIDFGARFPGLSTSFGGGLLVIAVASAIFLGTLVSPPSLMDDVDAVNAALARNMLESGDWVTGRLNGILYVDKAPLNYWLMAASYAVFGVHDWAARIPMGLAAVALCWLTFRFGSWAFSQQAGLWAGLALASSLGMFLFTRVRIPDTALTLAVTAALWALLRALDEEEPDNFRFPLLLGGSLATGVLLKGLLGLVFPVAIGAVYILLGGRLFSRAAWRRLRPLVVLGSFVLLAAPWHILATLRNPPYFDFTTVSRPGEYRGFFWRYFINEHVLRYVNTRYPRDYDTVPLLQFWLLHLVWLFPWSPFLPSAFVGHGRRGDAAPRLSGDGSRALTVRFGSLFRSARGRLDALNATRAGRVRLLLLIWIIFVPAFFSFSTSQEYYTLPAYPAFALLIGPALAAGGNAVRRGARAVSVVAGVAFLVATELLASVWNTPAAGDISAALTHNPEVYTLSLGHFQDLTLDAFAYLRLPLALAAGAFLIGAVGAWRRDRLALPALVVMMVIFTHAARQAMVVFDPYLSSRSLGDALREAPPGTFIADDQYYSFSSIFFYAHRDGRLLNGRRNNLEYGSNEPGAPEMFIDDDQFRRRWLGAERYYLATFERERPRLEALAGAQTLIVMKRAGGKLLLTNHPLSSREP